MRILCSISTRGRYYTTLPLAILSAINQTKQIDKLVVFDDNDEPKDMRDDLVYRNLYQMMDIKGIQWEWIFANKKGQHYNHQLANTMGYDFVWRLDDDNIADINVLEVLSSYITDDIGAVGGAVLTPPLYGPSEEPTGLIENIDAEPNIQWNHIKKYKEIDHLHCSFLYRAGIHDYNLGLSRVAHREETLFTYGLKQKGYKILVVPNVVTWHLKNPDGGIRSETQIEMFQHDQSIFENIIQTSDKTIVVLDCGMGDHVVFKHVLPDVKNPVVYSCYPEIIPGRSIQEAKDLYGDIDRFNIYRKMDEWHWKDSLENAFRKLYCDANL